MADYIMVCGEEDGDCTEVRKNPPYHIISWKPLPVISSSADSPVHYWNPPTFSQNLFLASCPVKVKVKDLPNSIIYPHTNCPSPFNQIKPPHLIQVEVDSDGTVSLSSIATQFTGNITHHTIGQQMGFRNWSTILRKYILVALFYALL